MDWADILTITVLSQSHMASYLVVARDIFVSLMVLFTEMTMLLTDRWTPNSLLTHILFNAAVNMKFVDITKKGTLACIKVFGARIDMSQISVRSATVIRV